MQTPEFVFFSLFRNDNPYASISLAMARVLARRHRVWYMNHPYSWKDLLKTRGDKAMQRRLPGLLRGQVQYEQFSDIPHNFTVVQPPPTLPINFLPPGRLYDNLHNYNQNVVLKTIKNMLRKHNVGPFVYINCYDPFFAGVLPPAMGAVFQIYHCIDDITQDPYTARHGAGLERKAMAEADLTLVTSSNLFRLHEPHAKRIHTFFNAADVTLFARALNERFDRPTELAGRTGPVIGFIGNLDALRIDFPLIKKTALAYPHATVLLVGPVNSPELSALGIDRLPNVVLAGSKPLQALPQFLQHMDCVLIPFLCNTLTNSIYPLKINEYLAAGKSVVSTAFSDDIRGFSDCIYLAASHEQFTRQVGEALQNNASAVCLSRSERARQNTWEVRIEQLYDLIGIKNINP
ncbi:MAG: glycosyltransferase [Saprospiraceae bacterium]|nr:glycosyltransferase [Saprospiraceae bacterium]